MGVYDPDDFAARVSYAAQVIQNRRPSSRAFDTCFEMYDGRAVCLALLRRSETNSALRENLPRYLSLPHLDEMRGDGPKNLKAYSRKLISEARNA